MDGSDGALLTTALVEGADLLERLAAQQYASPDMRAQAFSVAQTMRGHAARLAPPEPYNGLERALNYARGQGEVDARG